MQSSPLEQGSLPSYDVVASHRRPLRRHVESFFPKGDGSIPETRIEELVDVVIACLPPPEYPLLPETAFFDRLLRIMPAADPDFLRTWIRDPGPTTLVDNPHVACCVLDEGQIRRFRESAAYDAMAAADLGSEPFPWWMNAWSVGTMDFSYETCRTTMALRGTMVRGDIMSGHLIVAWIPSETAVILAVLCGSSFNDSERKCVVQRVRTLAYTRPPIEFPYDVARETVESSRGNGLYISRLVDAILGSRLTDVQDDTTTRQLSVLVPLLRIARAVGGHTALRALECPSDFSPVRPGANFMLDSPRRRAQCDT